MHGTASEQRGTQKDLKPPGRESRNPTVSPRPPRGKGLCGVLFAGYGQSSLFLQEGTCTYVPSSRTVTESWKYSSGQARGRSWFLLGPSLRLHAPSKVRYGTEAGGGLPGSVWEVGLLSEVLGCGATRGARLHLSGSRARLTRPYQRQHPAHWARPALRGRPRQVLLHAGCTFRAEHNRGGGRRKSRGGAGERPAVHTDR